MLARYEVIVEVVLRSDSIGPPVGHERLLAGLVDLLAPHAGRAEYCSQDHALGTRWYSPGMTTNDLIRSAERVLNPKMVGDRLFGDVASTLVTDKGNLYSGVCIDTGSGTGFCAEHSAIAAMVTAGEYRIEAIVAVWKDDNGTLYVLPPCGRCREFIRQIDEHNLDTDVVLGRDKVVKLRDLLPYHEWPVPLGKED